LQQIDGEEISAARMPGATVIRHGGSMKVFPREAQRKVRHPKSHVGCNKRSALHRMKYMRRNARWLLRPTLATHFFWESQH
jgi:hypothetical protein